MIQGAPEIRLPEVQPLNPFAERNELTTQFDAQTVKMLDGIAEHLSNSFVRWKIDRDFQFELPKSEFDHKRDRPLITYLSPQAVKDQGMVAPFNQEQLNELRRSGTFVVASRRHAVPYKWKVSSYLQLGQEQNMQNLNRGLGNAFEWAYASYNLYDVRKDLAMIKEDLKAVAMLYVGLKSTSPVNKNNQIWRELQKQRQLEVFKKYGDQLELDFFQYMDIPVGLKGDPFNERSKLINERTVTLNTVAAGLYTWWSQQNINIIDELEKQYAVNQIKQHIVNIQHEKFKQMIMSREELSLPIKKQIIRLTEQYVLIQQAMNDRVTRVSQSQVQMNKQIVQDFPIRSHCYNWTRPINQKFTKEITEREDRTMLDELKRKISTPFFSDYVEHYNNYDEHFKRVEQKIGKSETPTNTFTETYRISGPYQVQYRPQSYTYYIKTAETMTVDTTKNGWKLSYFWVLLVCFARSVFYSLRRNIWTGQLGIRALLETRKFYPQYLVNSDTGQIGRNPSISVTPIFAGLVKNFRLMKKLRADFENSPDSGMFDKRTAKVFHLMKVYGGIFLFRMVMWLCLIKPVIIVINIALSMGLLVMIPIWLPALLLIMYSWDTHINNYTSEFCNYYSRKVIWFPLLRYVIHAVVVVVVIVLKYTILSFMGFLVSLLIAAVNYTRYYARKAYDHAMFKLISTFGRSPVTDSGLAWRVEGPGISSTYFQSLKSSDIYVLVAAELEKIQLEILRAQIERLLGKPQQKISSFSGVVQNRLAMIGGYLNSTKLAESWNFYRNLLNQQYRSRLTIYPTSPGHLVRFTEEELVSYTRITKQMLMSFLNKYPYLDFYKHFGIRKKNPDRIVKRIWERIFQGGQVFSVLNDETQNVRFDVMKEAEEVEESERLVDRLRGEVRAGEDISGISSSVFAALNNEDSLLSIMPQDYILNQVAYLPRQMSNLNLPSSKLNIHLSVYLNPNTPVL